MRHCRNCKRYLNNSEFVSKKRKTVITCSRCRAEFVQYQSGSKNAARNIEGDPYQWDDNESEKENFDRLGQLASKNINSYFDRLIAGYERGKAHRHEWNN